MHLEASLSASAARPWRFLAVQKLFEVSHKGTKLHKNVDFVYYFLIIKYLKFIEQHKTV
jgi:hypothetical protein